MSTAETGPGITIVLADDHTLFREGIKEMLTTDPGMKIVGEAAEGNAAAALALKHCPDILLLDVEMPGPGAASVIRHVSSACPGVRIIVLTMHDDADLVQSLLSCGAAAYLVKTILRDELVATIRSVVRRLDTVMLSVSRQTIERLDSQRHGKRSGRLTSRESEVLRLTAQAYSNAQIARQLHIAEATVKRHLTNIYAKLDAVSRVDAIRKATVIGIISRVFT
jgi:DNA-binding NarL/FixJ family response regulator